MDKFFKLKEHGTTVRTEVIAGITTFVTMAYILFVNPLTLSDPARIVGDGDLASKIFNGVFVATAIAAFIGTALMGLLAKLPFAQAPGMGLNAFFAYTVMLTLGYSYQESLAIVFISGLLFIAITIFGLREAIVKAIPKNIQIAISAGIGLFLAFIGMQNAKLIVNNDAVLVGLADFTKLFDGKLTMAEALPIRSAFLALIGLILIAVFYKLKLKGSILIGIVVTAIIGIPMGITNLDVKMTSLSDVFSDFASTSFFKLDFASLFDGKSVWGSIIAVVLIVISFSLVDMFDTIGTLLGTAKRTGLLQKDGTLPNMKSALMCDAIATTSGALLGTSTVTTYVESGAGISEGGKTGLTSVVTSILFLLSLVIAPFVGIVPSAATAPALIFVGALMIGAIKEMEFDDMSETVPAFLTIALMPLTYSIATGIGVGLISYVLIKMLSARYKEINWVTVVIAILFIIKFFVPVMI